MRREDEVKLDIISGIDSELIDKHSAIRAERLAQHNTYVKRRRIISLASIAACILLIVSALFMITSPDEPAGIVSIVRSSSDGADIYTITYDDGRVATFEVINAEDESNESNITDVIHNESNELLLSLASGDTVNIGELGAEDTLYIKGATARSGGQMALKLSNDEELELGKVNNGNNGNGNNKNSITMAKINESGELVLGFASGAQINLGRVVGEKGEDGKDGVGIDGISLSESGELHITLTNGTTLNLGNIKGKDGIGIAESKINENGELVLTYTDGTVVNLGRVVGEKGEDGVGVAGIVINEQNELVFTMTDGSIVNVGNVKGEDGKSAYELYKEKFGYEGTEEEWLFDLVNGNLATKKEFTVTFDSAGGSEVPSQSVIALQYATEPPAPTRDGYEFDGWYLDDEKWNFASLVLNKDVTLTAKWNIITYDITYHANGGIGAEGNPSQYNTETYSMLLEPNKKGYEFKGWYADASFTTLVPAIVEGMFGELNLYAKWEIITYNITYVLGDGINVENPPTFTVEDLPLKLKPAMSTREHYEFVAWNDGNIATLEINSIGDVKLTAVWAPISYKINYITSGGSTPEEQSYTIESADIVLRDSVRNGYKFCGWYSDKEMSTPVTAIYNGSSGNITLYAKWEIITYTITYILNDGKMVEENYVTSYQIGSTAPLPSPEKDGYNFMGWATDSDNAAMLTSLNESIYGDLTLYAVYKFHYSYTVNGTEITITAYNGSKTELKIPSEIDGFTVTALKDGLFMDNNTLTAVTIPSTVKAIPRNAFARCTALKSVTLDGGVMEINQSAFANCSNLKSISFLGEITRIASAAFDGCTEIEKIYFNDIADWCGVILEGTLNAASPMETSENFTVYINGIAVTELVIPDGVKRIESKVFKNCKQFTSVVIPDSVEYIGEGAFNGCSGITSITIPFVGESRTAVAPNTTFGYIFGKAKYAETYSATQKTHCGTDDYIYSTTYNIPIALTSITVTNGKIGFGAFSECSQVTSIIFPDDITEIGDYAFEGCGALESILIPGSVKRIGTNAFYQCYELTEISIPKAVTEIGAYAFAACTNVKELLIPAGVTRIEEGVFNSCNKVRSIVFEGEITYFGDGAFAHCYRIRSFEIPDGITEIPDSMFAVCTGLQSVKIPESVTSIGAYAFTECYELKEVTIPTGVTVIKEWSFQSCGALTKIVIPDGVVTIEQSAFANCSGLQEVVLPDTLKTISSYAFSDCYNIHVIIPGGVTEIGEQAFDNVGSVLFKEGFGGDIGYDAFKNALYVYFEGNEADFPQADEFDGTDATVYFYSEEQPTTEGNYWHYIDGEITHWE